MQTLARGIHFFDLQFQQRPRAIACALLQGPGGVALVDPGPTTTLPAVRAALASAGLTLADVTDVLVTHIHLDHAGSVGVLVREQPRLRVHVHERGLPHLADPSKLLASAGRLYGDAMETLWGEVAPVATAALRPLVGGERLSVAGHDLEVAYTPGHAVHHVSYFHRDAGLAFVGDTAGVMVAAGGFVLPPTPPPDIDLEQWADSLDRIAAWHPSTLFLTHFGPAQPTDAHLAALRENMALVAMLAKHALEMPGSEDDREASFVAALRRELRRRLRDEEAGRYETSARFDLNWRGLARYWRKRSS